MAANTVTTVEELTRRLDSIPRVRLAHLPTPLDHCPQLSARLGGPPIWIKRDDLTGLASGGNKTRYLEYVLADARARGADTIVLSSGNQSNHCRQVAAACARLGMESVLLLWGSEPAEMEGNLLLDAILGAQIQHLDISGKPTGRAGHDLQFTEESPPQDRSLMRKAMEETKDRLRRQGRAPYCINTDASEGLQALGYVRCALELIEQMDRAGIDAAHIWVASGGATQAGLLAAGLLLGAPYRVTGVSYHKSSAGGSRDRIAAAATEAVRLLGYDLVVTPGQVDNDTGYATEPLYDGTELRWEPVLEVARAEGILLEPCYTGRVMLALRDRIRAGRWPAGRAAILVHSGGLPLLFPLGRRGLPGAMGQQEAG